MPTSNSTMDPIEMNNPPMALNHVQYIRNIISRHHSEELENLTKEEFGINMGDSEQLCVNKEHGSFDGHGDNYCLMKCSLNNNAIFDRNNNMFTIK